MTNYTYNENRNLELLIAPIIKDKIYKILYPNSTFIDNRDKSENDNVKVSRLQNLLKLTNISDVEIKKMLDCRMGIDGIVITKFKQLISFQEKTTRWNSWSNRHWWKDGLPKMKIRYQRKMYFSDTKAFRTYNAEFFRILADMYVIIYLNENNTDIKEWVMLSISRIKQKISQLDKLTDIAEYNPQGIDKDQEAQSFYSFPISNLKEAIVDGSSLFKKREQSLLF